MKKPSAKLASCKKCGALHRLPAQISVSQTASPCCGERLKALGRLKG